MLIVVDTNELFSAIISRNITLGLFFDSRLELVSPDFIIGEFEEHKDEISERTGLNEKEISAFLFLLSPKIKFFKKEDFSDFLKEAENISPDSDDVEYFALALKLNCPVWSEDKKLKKQGRVRLINTSELIKELDSFSNN